LPKKNPTAQKEIIQRKTTMAKAKANRTMNLQVMRSMPGL